VQRLYERDKRLGLHPQDFWLIDKQMTTKYKNVEIEKLVQLIDPSILQNAP
jgi:hypothetical protein